MRSPGCLSSLFSSFSGCLSSLFHIKNGKKLKGTFQRAVMVSNMQGIWDLNREKTCYLIPSLYLPLWEAQRCLSTFLLSGNTTLRQSVRCWGWTLKSKQALHELIAMLRRREGKILASSCFVVCCLIHLVIYNLLLVKQTRAAAHRCHMKSSGEKLPLWSDCDTDLRIAASWVIEAIQ